MRQTARQVNKLPHKKQLWYSSLYPFNLFHRPFVQMSKPTGVVLGCALATQNKIPLSSLTCLLMALSLTGRGSNRKAKRKKRGDGSGLTHVYFKSRWHGHPSETKTVLTPNSRTTGGYAMCNLPVAYLRMMCEPFDKARGGREGY